jgi:hypothetical protein
MAPTMVESTLTDARRQRCITILITLQRYKKLKAKPKQQIAGIVAKGGYMLH